MERCTGFAMALLLAGTIGADEPSAAGTADQIVKLLTDTCELLKSVKDKPSAESAREKLDLLSTELEKRKKSVETMPREQRNQVQRLLARKGKSVDETLSNEVERILKLPETSAVLKDCKFLKSFLEARKEMARIKIQALTEASEIFYGRYERFPKELEELLKPPDGGAPFVEKEALTDPWGRSFKIDPAGPKNKGLRPDIWSPGAPGEKDGVIGNWPVGPPPESSKGSGKK